MLVKGMSWLKAYMLKRYLDNNESHWIDRYLRSRWDAIKHASKFLTSQKITSFQQNRRALEIWRLENNRMTPKLKLTTNHHSRTVIYSITITPNFPRLNFFFPLPLIRNVLVNEDYKQLVVYGLHKSQMT